MKAKEQTKKINTYSVISPGVLCSCGYTYAYVLVRNRLILGPIYDMLTKLRGSLHESGLSYDPGRTRSVSFDIIGD